MGVKVFPAPIVGLRAFLRRYWGDDCPGKFGPTYHNAMREIDEVLRDDVNGILSLELSKELFGEPADYAPEQWPTTCETCGAIAPAEDDPQRARQVFVRRTHRIPDGSLVTEDKLPAGAAWWSKWKHDREHIGSECFDRDTCDPRGHLHVVLPDGTAWDVMSRASNCTAKQERTHFCWVLHGELEAGTLHVDKGGNTCAAGAGSIATSGYHGFLQHGELVSC